MAVHMQEIGEQGGYLSVGVRASRSKACVRPGHPAGPRRPISFLTFPFASLVLARQSVYSVAL